MALSLERCAEMRAEMDTGRLRDDVLTRAGVSADEWTVAQRGWLDRMGAELVIGRFELTNSYSKAFLERQRALQAPRPPVDDGGRAPKPPVDDGGRAPKPPVDDGGRAPKPPAATLSPTVLPVPAAPLGALLPPEPLPVPSLGGTASGAPSPWVAAPPAPLPFAPAAATPPQSPPGASPAPPPPPVKRAPAALSGTSMGFVAPKGPALPFAKGAPAPPPAPPAPAAPLAAPPVKRAPAALSGTAMGFIAPRGALPFASGTPVAAAAAAEAPNVAADAEGGTMPATMSPLARPALPFKPGAPPALPRLEPRHVLPGTAGIDDGESETLDIPLEELVEEDTGSAALPFPPGAEPSRPKAPEPPAAAAAAGPTLTLQHYASLCAELAVFRDRSEAIFQHYGLGNPRDRVAVDLLWQERLRRNPTENQGWQNPLSALGRALRAGEGGGRGLKGAGAGEVLL